MKDTADVTGGKPIDVLSQPISGVSAINQSNRRKGEVLFFYFVPETTQDKFAYLMKKVSSPDCDVCGTIEDVQHILVDYKNMSKRET
jgi:hypothetical protein